VASRLPAKGSDPKKLLRQGRPRPTTSLPPRSLRKRLPFARLVFGTLARYWVGRRRSFICGAATPTAVNYPPVLKACHCTSPIHHLVQEHPTDPQRTYMGNHECVFYRAWERRPPGSHFSYGPQHRRARRLVHQEESTRHSMVHLTESRRAGSAVPAVFLRWRQRSWPVHIGGSGSTLIAAEQNKRPILLMDCIVCERHRRALGSTSTGLSKARTAQGITQQLKMTPEYR